KTEDIEMELAEIEIQPKSRVDNMTIRDAGGKYAIEALIVSVLEKGENISVTKASGSMLMKAGQRLIAIGTREQVAQLEELASI
ncbi:MAG: TrkA C-terminal domain-containing protein, partial [Actinomycetia bacterium]|nr:TrkA C-terminal domain-containing protein [Actinomycetes bacterium]